MVIRKAQVQFDERLSKQICVHHNARGKGTTYFENGKRKGKNLVESFGIVLTYSYLCSTLSDNKT
jgi:hypothetical protein